MNYIPDLSKKYWLALVGTCIIGMMAHAQTPGMVPLDPSGFVTKYNTDFDGIGPEVYVLPAPRSQQEVLVDTYREKSDFFDSISHHLDYQKLIEGFRSTSNKGYILQNIKPLPSSTEQWEELINKLQQNNNRPLAAGIANEFALELLRNRETSKAISVLRSGMSGLQPGSERMALQFNLSNTLLYIGDNNGATALQESYLSSASINRDIKDQADILVAIARSEADRRNYRAAENTIIRKAIPLYNKIKDTMGKVNAWTSLARIYQIQNKHTQAQWFLIQARELAISRDYQNDLAEMEYMLGYSKYVQQNYSVAKLELERAMSMANRENNKILQLAISDKLGDTYMKLGDYKEAESALVDYWRLRREVFP
ncbi:tetratricopeptide repeat protein [Sphingobacterium sp. PU5-4]|uniref:Tetratricopeptide repeat protein n=1 Tax=Sphingobacterium tenebrionis TaxID=3111775 RepID=A0ABU8I187_9SPHI